MAKDLKQSINIKEFAIYDEDGTKLNTTEISSILKELFEDAYLAQNFILNEFYRQGVKLLNNKSHAAEQARALPSWPVPDKYNYKHNTNEMAQREVSRLLTALKERVEIAEILEQNNWDMSYENLVEELGKKKYLNFELYKNILRSKKVPTLLEIKNPRICFGFTNTDFADKPYIEDNYIVWNNVTLFDKNYTLLFKIQNKLLFSYRNIKKVSKPTMRIDKETLEVMFDFTIYSEAAVEPEFTNKTLGVDLGQVETITCSEIDENGILQTEYLESWYSSNHSKKLAKLEKELYFVNKKYKAKRDLGLNTYNIGHELHCLRNKITNIKKSLAWSAACDVVTTASPDTKIILEDLRWIGGHTKWNAGEFRSCIKHLAIKQGRKIKFVSPKNTSQKCFNCKNQLKLTDRDAICSTCNTTLNRDRNAARNIAIKNKNIERIANQLTIKRSTRSFNTQRARFTGLNASISSIKVRILTRYRLVQEQSSMGLITSNNNYHILLKL